jgi:hypothetical protein
VALRSACVNPSTINSSPNWNSSSRGTGIWSATTTVAGGRPIVEAMAEQEDRVVVRCRPYATFAQPPRHLHRNDQDEQITHWVSATVPWDAADPV